MRDSVEAVQAGRCHETRLVVSPQPESLGAGCLDAACRPVESAPVGTRSALWHSLSCLCQDCLHGDVLWTDRRHEVPPGYPLFAAEV
jgi:hypothetical protein